VSDAAHARKDDRGRAVALMLLRQYGFSLVLFVQLMLGMIVNLFVTIPKQHPGAGGPEYFSGSNAAVGWAIVHGGWALSAHVVLGTVLLIGGAAVVVPAVKTKDRATLVTSVLTALFIFSAVGNGASFLVYNHDFSSMIMAASFAGAVVSNVTNLYLKTRVA
jgi:hypothetical protein